MTAQTIELSPERTLTVIQDGFISGYLANPDFSTEEQNLLIQEVKGSIICSAGELALSSSICTCPEQMIFIVEPFPGDKRTQKRIVEILQTIRAIDI